VSEPERSPRARPQRTLRFTRQGRFYVLVTLGVGAAALNTGANLLYLVLGLLLSLVILSGVLSDLVLFWVRPTRVLPRRAHAGTPFLVEIALFNEKRFLPSFSIEVEDVAPDAPTDRRTYFLRVEPGGERRAVYERRAESRGLLRFSELVLRTSYPFGLFEKTLRYRAEDLLVVYPALEPDRAGLDSAERRFDSESAERPGHGTEVLHLREYGAGDEARAVHARRSAALGRLVVRERARAQAPRLELTLDDLLPDATERGQESPARRDAFERAIRRLAWLATTAHGRGADVALKARSGRTAAARAEAPLDPVLAFLALVELVTEEEARGTLPPDARRAIARAVAPEARA
jgi:uncharacterized protein (DUF58 family)